MNEDLGPRWMQLGIFCLIVYSIACTCLETVPEFARWTTFFRISEIVVVTIFTIEYFYFWILSPTPRKYPLQPMRVIDLLAIAPFYLQLGVDLRTLRSLRLLRLFRVLRLSRHSQAMRTIGEAVSRTWPELSSVGFIAAIVILISAMALYYAEHDAQPQIYSSIPASLWWSIVTLTTVGYGDVYPVTFTGRVVASIIMLTGIGLIALPAGILSSTLTEIIRERREDAHSIGAANHSD